MKINGSCRQCGSTNIELLTGVVNYSTNEATATGVCRACGHLMTLKATPRGVEKLKKGNDPNYRFVNKSVKIDSNERLN